MSARDRKTIKIAYIGGGSRNWARGLMRDLALCPRLDGQISLYDLDYVAAQRNVAVGQAIFSHPQARGRFEVTACRRSADALRKADFVVMSIEPGPMSLRRADLEIPAKFGIVQPVGDTIGPGGLLRALRAIPVYADYAHQVMIHCPRAWVINYTNPMSLCTAALFAAQPAIKAFGCCHEVFGTQAFLAGKVEQWFKVPRPRRADIRLDISGVNHFTFATAARWNGHDLFPRLDKLIARRDAFADGSVTARQRKKAGKWFASDHLIALDFLRRFGALGAAGDRHLAEFVPWYLGSEKSLHRWGVVLTPFSYRMATHRRRSGKFRLPDELKGTGEEGVQILTALCGLGDLVTNVNYPNQGQNPDLPLGAVTESYARFGQDSLQPLVSGQLPEMLAGHVRRIIDVQETALQAGLLGDVDLAFQALLCDSLVHLSTDAAWDMFSQMLHDVKKHLPGWCIS